MSSEVLREIESVKSFFSSRGANDPGNSTLRHNFANTLIQHINTSLSLSKSDATHLHQALEGSPYEEEHLRRIYSSIDRKLLNSTVVKPAVSIKDHTLKNWWNFCTAADWELFRNKQASWHSKMTKLVERANLLGCTNPDQQSLKWMLSMLLMIQYPIELPSAPSIYQKLQDLKNVVASERKEYPVELIQLAVFPSGPAELPEDIHKYAYADGEPTTVDMPGIASIAGHKVPLKSNNRLLQVREQIDSAKRQPSASPTRGDITSGASGVAESPIAARASVHMTADDLPIDGDRVEQGLYTNYKANLWKHRAVKGGLLQSNESVEQRACAATMKVESDGSVTLVSRLCQKYETDNVKKEKDLAGEKHIPAATSVKAEASSGSVKAPIASAKAESNASDDELDGHESAAIAALGLRNAGKKLNKKHAAATSVEKVIKVMKKEKKEEKEKKEKHIDIVSKAEVKKAMPKDVKNGNPPAIHYSTGVVYTDMKNHKFRCLCIRNDVYTEKATSWGKKRTKKQAWTECIHAIDEHAANVANK